MLKATERSERGMGRLDVSCGWGSRTSRYVTKAWAVGDIAGRSRRVVMAGAAKRVVFRRDICLISKRRFLPTDVLGAWWHEA